MATEITTTFSAFNPEELKDWSKVIHELTFNDPTLNELHDIETGILFDQQIVFAGRMRQIGKKTTGCAPNAANGVALSEKFWRPVKMDFRLEHCSADVNVQNKLINQMTKINPDYFNVIDGSQSVIGNFLVASVIDGFNESLLKLAWFGDKTAALISGGGVFKAGTDLDLYNPVDGFYKQLFAEIPTTASNYVGITKNAGANYAAQELASGDAMAIFKKMYEKADPRALEASGAKFYVTLSLWNGYLNDLESTQNSGAGNTMINEKGQVSLTYRGIPVVKMHFADRFIKENQDNGTKLNLPHRAVLSNPMNLKIGTLATDDFGSVDAFYDRTQKLNIIDGAYSLDVKHLEKYQTVFAY